MDVRVHRAHGVGQRARQRPVLVVELAAVDEFTNRIVNRRNGRIYQVIINTLSEDGDMIENEYVRLDDQGRIMRVTHATYRRILQ